MTPTAKIVHLLDQGMLSVPGHATTLEDAAALALMDIPHPYTFIAEDHEDAYVVAIIPPRNPEGRSHGPTHR